MWEWPRVRAVEEGADRDVHGGPASAATRPQVPQQASVQRCWALEATPLSQEQQRPLTPRWASRGRRCPQGVLTAISSPGNGAFGEVQGLEVPSAFLGVLPQVGRPGTPRCSSRSCGCRLSAPCHHHIFLLSKLLKTTFFLCYALILVYMKSELEMIPTNDFSFYVWYPTYRSLAKMGFLPSPEAGDRLPQHCHILSTADFVCLSHPTGGLGGRAAVCSSAHFRTGFFPWIERSCSPRRAHVGPPRVRLARGLWPAGGRGRGPSRARSCAAAPRWKGWQWSEGQAAVCERPGYQRLSAILQATDSTSRGRVRTDAELPGLSWGLSWVRTVMELWGSHSGSCCLPSVNLPVLNV